MEPKSPCCDTDQDKQKDSSNGCCGSDVIEAPIRVATVSREDVKDYYGRAGENPQADLCCPTLYKNEDIAHIPPDVMEVSYGCGSPVTLSGLRSGETHVDLGSGGGVDCFISSKYVGPKGRVIGIDMTPEMMARAQKNATKVGEKLGYQNVQFKHGYLENVPLKDETADLLTSNCVVNLSPDKKKVFQEVKRVLKDGGRFVISDIVAEAPVPEEMEKDKELWGECISGALTEKEFLEFSKDAGFYGLEILKKTFFKEVQGYNFWSVTLRGWKRKKGKTCNYVGQYATYLGPYSQVADDEGHTFLRGVPQEICTDTATKLSNTPYAKSFLLSGEPTSQEAASCCSPSSTEEADTACCETSPTNGAAAASCSPQPIKTWNPKGEFPTAPLTRLETLWFQVAGTLCNLECSHCLVSASPTNKSHLMMSLAEIKPVLEEAKELGFKEYYFTGGEPFMNREMVDILEETLKYGPANVLTNGTLITPKLADRLKKLNDGSFHPLGLRVSMDGTTQETNDPIRGAGTFPRILEGIKNLATVGLDPVITVTTAAPEFSQNGKSGRAEFTKLLQSLGLKNPRLKILGLFHIGEEENRTSGYKENESLKGIHLTPDELEKLQCTTSRMVTRKGTYVCPILINDPIGKMGETLKDSLKPYKLTTGACYTCYKEGVTCRT